ncbi:carbon-nitrogen hydrolase family protein [Lentibacillus sediminis]|uniref:carbon-nitrogen hydrolase family protein n=1 Tax=Lentibacillus sediminis TaxID=1940529 RepID=UPI000C1BC94C|nr:carbon-nitrogen hydrolase family protein [Lentibacillus sediminis]
MARHVTVSALSPFPMEVEQNDTSSRIVSKMKDHWSKHLELAMTDQPDLLVLPECCDRPVIRDKERRNQYYQERGDQLLDLFSEAAKKNRCYIAYSAFKVMSDGTKRNCTQLLDRQGEVVGTYYKNFLTIGEMSSGIICGNEPLIVECDFGTVGITICYDLIFDELRAAYSERKPDILIHSSLGHFGMRHNYWAFSCRSHYVGAIARKEGQIISPLGDVIDSSSNYSPVITGEINLDCKITERFTAKEHFDRVMEIKKKYGNKVKMTYPASGELGSFLFSSETDEFTIDEVLKEFNIMTFDEKLEKTIAFRNKQLENLNS